MMHNTTKSDWDPLEPPLHQQQLTGIMQLLPDDRPGNILDLGCGSGRILLPLSMIGHRCLGVDSDLEALDACRASAAEAPDDVYLNLLHCDFNSGGDEWVSDIATTGPFDLVMCVGHTWMLMTEPYEAVRTLQKIMQLVEPTTGVFVIDTIPTDLWPHVAHGDWVTGISEDRESQIVWAADDNVFALRESADNVDVYHDDSLKPDDRLHRLWTWGELRLLAQAAGLPEPTVDTESHLILFRCPTA